MKNKNLTIGIAINDVLRDFLGQFEYTYNKYIVENPEPEGGVLEVINHEELRETDDRYINIDKNPITSFNLIEHFPFENVEAMNNFLYREAALEIFGHADELHPNLINQLNMFIMDMKDLEGHEVVIISREAITAIPSTLFFLSKTSCKCENIKFVTSYADQWNDVDILITANPTVLNNRPSDKISVKVNTTYNENVSADYEIETLFDFMTDDALRKKIITTKLTNYEEL